MNPSQSEMGGVPVEPLKKKKSDDRLFNIQQKLITAATVASITLGAGGVVKKTEAQDVSSKPPITIFNDDDLRLLTPEEVRASVELPPLIGEQKTAFIFAHFEGDKMPDISRTLVTKDLQKSLDFFIRKVSGGLAWFDLEMSSGNNEEVPGWIEMPSWENYLQTDGSVDFGKLIYAIEGKADKDINFKDKRDVVMIVSGNKIFEYGGVHHVSADEANKLEGFSLFGTEWSTTPLSSSTGEHARGVHANGLPHTIVKTGIDLNGQPIYTDYVNPWSASGKSRSKLIYPVLGPMPPLLSAPEIDKLWPNEARRTMVVVRGQKIITDINFLHDDNETLSKPQIVKIPIKEEIVDGRKKILAIYLEARKPILTGEAPDAVTDTGIVIYKWDEFREDGRFGELLYPESADWNSAWKPGKSLKIGDVEIKIDRELPGGNGYSVTVSNNAEIQPSPTARAEPTKTTRPVERPTSTTRPQGYKKWLPYVGKRDKTR